MPNPFTKCTNSLNDAFIASGKTWSARASGQWKLVGSGLRSAIEMGFGQLIHYVVVTTLLVPVTTLALAIHGVFAVIRLVPALWFSLRAGAEWLGGLFSKTETQTA